MAATVQQHKFADRLTGDAALTGFCYDDLDEGDEFNEYKTTPVMRFFEETVGFGPRDTATAGHTKLLDLAKVAALGKYEPSLTVGEEFATEYNDLLRERNGVAPVLGRFDAVRKAVQAAPSKKEAEQLRRAKQRKNARQALKERNANARTKLKRTRDDPLQTSRMHSHRPQQTDRGLGRAVVPNWRLEPQNHSLLRYADHDNRMVPPPPADPPPPPPPYPPPSTPPRPAQTPLTLRLELPARPLVYPPPPHLYHFPRHL